MSAAKAISSSDLFSQTLYERMKRVNIGIADMELYEFRYALDNLHPENGGWASVELDTREEIEKLINDSNFYASIQLKPRVGDQVVLDRNIVRLTNMLLVGLVTEQYPVEWVRAHFHFDIRGFFFLHRTVYFTDKVLAHLGGKPFRSFEHCRTYGGGQDRDRRPPAQCTGADRQAGHLHRDGQLSHRPGLSGGKGHPYPGQGGYPL
jgi:hypothetical protein